MFKKRVISAQRLPIVFYYVEGHWCLNNTRYAAKWLAKSVIRILLMYKLYRTIDRLPHDIRTYQRGDVPQDGFDVNVLSVGPGIDHVVGFAPCLWSVAQLPNLWSGRMDMKVVTLFQFVTSVGTTRGQGTIRGVVVVLVLLNIIFSKINFVCFLFYINNLVQGQFFTLIQVTASHAANS